MSRRVIDRAEWADYVNAFSRRHKDWLISLAVDDDAETRRYVTRDTPLRGVVAELDDDASSIIVFSGDTAHFVGHATGLEVDETSEGADAALTILDQLGRRTVVEFQSPQRPELVDGIP